MAGDAPACVRSKRFGAISGAGPARMRDQASFRRKRLRKSVAPNVAGMGGTEARQGYSTYHYKILPASPSIRPYNCSTCHVRMMDRDSLVSRPYYALALAGQASGLRVIDGE